MSRDFAADEKKGLECLALETDLTDDQKAQTQLLVQNGQAHVFKNWSTLSKATKDAFLLQIAEFQAGYPGGVESYVTKARQLLAKSQTGDNPYEGYDVAPPASSVCFTDGPEEFKHYETLGMQNIGQTAFVLVAGGLGERLGYNGIKISLPWETESGKAFLQVYIEHLLAYQTHARLSDEKVVIQLGIMTSGDTHDLTMKLLTDFKYFGAEPSQVTVFKQGLVPALEDNDAHFQVTEEGSLVSKPHGHGDVHMLLYQQEIVRNWQRDHGVQWLMFFQDTNGLIFRAIPGALGVSVEKKLIMNYVCSTRRQGDAVGAITTLTRQAEGKGDESLPDALTINVEYNQIKGLLGDIPEPEVNGFSVYPGNTNSLVFSVTEYLAVLDKTRGVISEFVNPKYQPGSTTQFVKPTRLECMMQDFPKLLTTADATRVGFSQFPAWTSFSPVKNALAGAAAKQRSGNNPECAVTGEISNYVWNRNIMHRAGVNFTGSVEQKSFGGVTVDMAARISLAPAMGSTQEQVAAKFPGDVSITTKSSLVVDGAGEVYFENLTLDGRLSITACAGARVTVNAMNLSNAGWSWTEVDATTESDPAMAIRAFNVVKGESADYVISTPGVYTLSDAGVQAVAQN